MFWLRRRIHPDSFHPGEIDHEGIVRGPETRHAVAAGSDRDREPLGTGSLDGPMTSATPWQQTTTAGFLSIIAL